ncbi:hypothetical protein NAL19_2705 [Pectobacterium sp. F1-1]|nr:hypothetical protein NAL19_2705 [Pectobacterium sp. F1-1]
MVMDFLTCFAFVLLMLHKFLIWVISVDGGAIMKVVQGALKTDPFNFGLS